MADITESIPFAFDDIYEGVQQKFAEAGYDTAEGSNTSQLVTAMTYLTSMLNMNTAININEVVLPLATKRDNALKDARVLGYEPAARISYVYTLTISIPDGGNFILPKYTEFKSGTKTYYYFGDRLEFENVDPGFEFSIDVKEGVLYKFSEEDMLNVVSGTIIENEKEVNQYYIDIPYVNIENNGIELFMTYYDSLGNLYQQEEWEKSTQFLIDNDSTLDKTFVRLDNIDYKTPRIYFKFGNSGAALRRGTIVEMNVLESNGVDGAMEDTPTVDRDDCEILSYQIKLQGTGEESISSIQKNAPLFHNSANRAITHSDYIAISNRQETVEFSEVWDGFDEYPKKAGHIWFSFKPHTNVREFSSDEFNKTFQLDNPNDNINWYLEDAEVQAVWDFFKEYKVPTLIYNNRHPVYIDFDYEIDVAKYNIKTSIADINQDIFDVIDNYFKGDDGVETFAFEYFQSNLNKRIDEYLTDITGFDIKLTTSCTFSTRQIVREDGNYSKLLIQLGVPYEDYSDDSGNILTDVLPSINTDLIDGYYNLFTDFSTPSYADFERVEFPIVLGDQQAGVYRIHTTTEPYITVELWIKTTDGYITGLHESEIQGMKMNIVYPSSNIKFMRNSLPRLNSVKF